MFPREYKREKIKSPVALGAVKEASLSEFDLTANLFRGASPTAAAAAPYPSVTSEATLSAPMILTTGPALRHAWNLSHLLTVPPARVDAMRFISPPASVEYVPAARSEIVPRAIPHAPGDRWAATHRSAV